MESEDDEHVICTICEKAFHLKCIAAISPLPADWACPACVSGRPKGGNSDSTPLRYSNSNVTTTRPHKRAAINSPPESAPCSAMSHDLVRDVVQEVVQVAIKKEMEDFFLKMGDQMRNIIAMQLSPIKKEIQDLQTSMSFINEQYEDVMKFHKNSTEIINNLQKENSVLHDNVRDLNYRLSQMEQQSRASNIEIQCVPENKNENITNIVKKISGVIESNIKEENIVSCTRIAKYNRSSARPRSIIVQFDSVQIRDQFLNSTSKFNKANPDNKLNTSQLGLSGVKDKSPIFIVEHLSPANKALHAAARLQAKEKNFKYVWVRNGRVYMRKNDTSEHVFIKDMDTLNKLV